MKHSLSTLATGAVIALASFAAHAAFQVGMSAEAMTSEVRARVTNGQGCAAIATQAATSLVASDAGKLASALLSQGCSAEQVISTVIQQFGASDQVTLAVLGAARAAGVDNTVARNAAVLGGANVNVVNPATAAGPGAGGEGGGFGGGGGTNFGTSMRSTFIGGSGGSRNTNPAASRS